MYLPGLYRKSGIYNAVRNIKSVTEDVCEYKILLNKRLLNCDEVRNQAKWWLGTMPVFPQHFGFQIGEFLVSNGLYGVFLTIFESGSILNIDSTH